MGTSAMQTRNEFALEDGVAIFDVCREIVGRGELPTISLLRAALPDVPMRVIKRQLLRFRMRNRGVGF